MLIMEKIMQATTFHHVADNLPFPLISPPFITAPPTHNLHYLLLSLSLCNSVSLSIITAMAATFSSNMVSTSFLKRQPMAVSSLKSLSPKICQSLFGLKSANSRGGRVVAMAVHKVKLITPEGKKEFKCPDNSYILERAEEEGIDLPYTCLAGACSSCAGKVISGTVDQSLNSFLEQEQIDEGWVLTCVARPKGDVVIQTHMEGELFA